MAVVEEKTKNKLEWQKIIKKLTSFADTPLGQELCRRLEPSCDLDWIKSNQMATGEAVALLCRGVRVPLNSITDIRPFIRLARRGGMLNVRELYQIQCFLKIGRKVRTFLLQNGETSFFIDMGTLMPCLPKLQSELERCLLSPEELSDKASPTLQDLRRKIAKLKGKLHEYLEGMVRSPKFKQYLQEPLITVRNERYVLPVKHEFRQHINGIVHDQSASGATLFIEPLAALELGNKLREVLSQEEREVERILTELSSQIGQEADSIDDLLDQLGQLDFILAKGKLSLDLDASLPKINQDGYLDLHQARNPLLGAAAVPSDIWLGRSFRTLVITGPNTGGKTVLLKTVGLLVLMHQAGLHIPARDDSELPVFNRVFCDLGDEQSIEQSLSTFSAHMANIISILQKAGKGSLVLLDELGAGTDPSEGAALGMAVLDYLNKKDVRTIATTHYSDLKSFAYTQAGVENASVEFDPVTLQPTYRLIIGLPGHSNALEIASRLGLGNNIIEKARSFLCYADARTDSLIRSLEKKRQHLEDLTAAAYEAKKKAEAIRQELKERQQSLAAKENALIQQAKENAIRAVNYARRESERIIKELRKQTSKLLEKERTQAAEAARTNLSTVQNSVYASLGLDRDQADVVTTDAGVDISALELGRNVYIPHLKVHGTVIDLPDNEGNIKVQAGILKLTLPVEQIQLSSFPAQPKPKPQRFVATLASSKAQTISPELDLRGFTVSECQYELEKFLDDAQLASLDRIKLIHGKGTGALRKAVHDYLKIHPGIKTFSLAGYKEGGTGVTIAILKK